MTIYGYARVSTDGQTLDSQVEALKAAGCEKIFREKVSGARADRPQLLRLLAAIGSGDVLIVSRLDRLARSTRDLLNILDTLASRGAAFRSLGDQWADTTTPHGRLMLTVLGGLAEFERELIRARTGDGRARAMARGQHMGRPPALTPASTGRRRRGRCAPARRRRPILPASSMSAKARFRGLADKALASPAPAKPRIDADTERAARAFLKRLEGKYPVIESILYGSRARGDHKPDSDADIAVILPGERGDRYKVVGEFAGIEFDVMLETGILVQAVPFWEDELRHPERFNNPALIENIKREGLRL